MQPRRLNSDDSRGDSCENLVVPSETLRNASHRAPKGDSGKNGDERVSVFWRLFGGTLLSIAALAVITAYQSIASSIHELRNDLAKANEARAELVKKDEYSTARGKIWDKLQEMQKEQQTGVAPIPQLQQRMDKIEETEKAEAADHRETHETHATLKERLAQVELQLTNGRTTQKDVQTLLQQVAGLQEKGLARDQQLQQLQEERKELAKDIQALRERLVKVEAAKESGKTSSKTTAKSETGD
ncbi:MAG: hypothetical protein ACJ8F7_07900 [Gemmataceae bacterium]